MSPRPRQQQCRRRQRKEIDLLKRIHVIAVAALLLGAHTLFAASKPLIVPIGGNFVDATGHNGTFMGQFALLQFAAENNQLVAKGFLSGIMTDSTGHVVASVVKDVSVPVAVSPGASSTARLSQGKLSIATNATCPILH